MGLFDLPSPLLTWMDEALLGALPPVFRLVAWGLVGSIVSMGVYRLISPQARIAELRHAAVSARRRMAAYDGEFSGLGDVALTSLGLSFRHVGAVLLPAVFASLPVICLLAWLSNSYGYQDPRPGQAVAVQVDPSSSSVSWQSASNPEAGGVAAVVWPGDGETLRLIDEQSRVLLELPLSAAVPLIHKKQWWNHLLSNPLGYLPADSPVEKVSFTLPPRTSLPVEPTWLGGWEMIFLTVLFLASIAIKMAFRIH